MKHEFGPRWFAPYADCHLPVVDQVIRDDAEASILRLELEDGRVEWVALNPRPATIKSEVIETHEP